MGRKSAEVVSWWHGVSDPMIPLHAGAQTRISVSGSSRHLEGVCKAMDSGSRLEMEEIRGGVQDAAAALVNFITSAPFL